MRLSEQRKELENLNVENENTKKYKIIAVDDEIGIIDSLTVFLKHSGYTLVGCTNPYEAIEKVRNEHFDLMLLDFMMDPIHGDTVVEEIRKFNEDRDWDQFHQPVHLAKSIVIEAAELLECFQWSDDYVYRRLCQSWQEHPKVSPQDEPHAGTVS